MRARSRGLGAAAVVPVLVEGAEMPPEEGLPEALRPLANVQAMRVQNDRDIAGLPGTVWHLVRYWPGGTASPCCARSSCFVGLAQCQHDAE